MSIPKVSAHQSERKKLERAGTLHWFHWLIVSLSLLLTLFAWHFTKQELNEKVEAKFERETNHAIELVLERMQKYEDALWGGVAYIRASGGNVNYAHWRQYARSIRTEQKYPGINGIGVIHAMPRENALAYLDGQRKLRPEYRVHPEHDGDELWPISYIIPVKGNEKAVGLDMAHETNRFTAAKKTRDTGHAQITGPITLVQDAEQTPGFLFYAPIYAGDQSDSTESRRKNFRGMVYAPFVVKKLMQGTLEKEKRHIGIQIQDENHILYDEHVETEADFDPNPLFKKNIIVPLYGRNWHFSIWSAKSFRQAASNNEPLAILIGGFTIDGLLIILFYMISRTSRRALSYADNMTSVLETRTADLEKLNAELSDKTREIEQFVYTVSHDLKSPLVTQVGLIGCLREDLTRGDDQLITDLVNRLEGATLRMRHCIEDLLELSRVGQVGHTGEMIDVGDLLKEIHQNLSSQLHSAGATLHIQEDLPCITADRIRVLQLFENLIINAIKYAVNEDSTKIWVKSECSDGEIRFCVEDNGPGIASQYHEKVFTLFQRLDENNEDGTGIGLTAVRRIMEIHEGRVWLESEEGKGARFWVAFPQRVPAGQIAHQRG